MNAGCICLYPNKNVVPGGVVFYKEIQNGCRELTLRWGGSGGG